MYEITGIELYDIKHHSEGYTYFRQVVKNSVFSPYVTSSFHLGLQNFCLADFIYCLCWIAPRIKWSGGSSSYLGGIPVSVRAHLHMDEKFANEYSSNIRRRKIYHVKKKFAKLYFFVSFLDVLICFRKF